MLNMVSEYNFIDVLLYAKSMQTNNNIETLNLLIIGSNMIIIIIRAQGKSTEKI